MENGLLRKIIQILFIVLVLFSGYLSYTSLGEGRGFCLTGDDYANSGCSAVQGSIYGFIFGVKVAHLGFAAILLLASFYYFGKKKWKYRQNFYEIYLLGTVVGTLFSLYFLYIQFFVLGRICSTCLVVDFGMILVFILSILDYKNGNQRFS